jgi:predicted nucleic acid-binding protein
VGEPWVINASPVIVPAKLGLIDKVPGVASPLVIPEPVASEIRHGKAGDPAVCWLNEAGRGFIKPAEPSPAHLTRSRIGAGERSVIAWALAHSGFVAVLDDSAARSQARRLSLPVLGTVGIVIRMKQAGLIERAKPWLLQIRQAGGHIGEELLRDAIRYAGEDS